MSENILPLQDKIVERKVGILLMGAGMLKYRFDFVVLSVVLLVFCVFAGCAARTNGIPENAEAIARNIQTSVATHPDISDYSLRVNIRGSHVTLGGSTKNPLQARLIEAIALETPGVSKVTNDIVVSAGPSDQEIKEAIMRELEYDGSLFIDVITVKVQNGVVSLEGSLPDAYAIDGILSHVLNAEGVKDIKSGLTVNGKPYPVDYL